ncbi:MAG: spondin domain-containing protein [Gammaproteobacteria bacterium]|nr:spondin domain-containing protein [Gammaproteobacteria bacterium]
MSKKITVIAGCILSTTVFAAVTSWAGDIGDIKVYEVTLTNLTPGQPIAPVMVAAHQPGMSFFVAGEAPSEELAALAEAGNGAPMAEKLRATPGFTAAEVGAGGTGPGQTSTLMITTARGDHLSLGAMLGNTNDAFVALTDVPLPKGMQMTVYMASAYDAGSETNDELCATVPGPACGGEALSPDDSGEGFVYIHNGIHGIGGLSAAEYDWRNPVAKIVIKRVQ